MSVRTAGELKYCNSLGVFNKTIIPLTFDAYETGQLGAVSHWLITISYPTHTLGIIVKYCYNIFSIACSKFTFPTLSIYLARVGG